MHTFKLFIAIYVLDNYVYCPESRRTCFFHLLLLSQIFIDYSSIFVIIILASNDIGDEGVKALAEALKLNKNLAHLNLCIRSFTIININNYYIRIVKCWHF